MKVLDQSRVKYIMNIGYIYELYEVGSDNIRYIGQTVNPKNRIKKHICDSRKVNNHCRCWVNGIISRGGKIGIRVIEECEQDMMDFWEKHYISMYKCWGFNLTNMTDGGFAKKVLSKESRDRISKSLTGRKQTEETKKRRINSLAETWKSEELRDLKRRQTTYLCSIGILSKKGVPSKKKGIPLCDELKKRMSDTQIQQYKNGRIPHNKNLRRVVKIGDNDCVICEYKNPTDAARSIGGYSKRIISVCEGRLKTHKGFKWKYYENK